MTECINMTTPTDGIKKVVPHRVALARLTDYDERGAILLQQLCYWTSRSHDPYRWVQKTAAEFCQAVYGEDSTKLRRRVQRALNRLVSMKLVEAEATSGGGNRYRVCTEIPELDAAVEASRGPSSIVAAAPQNTPERGATPAVDPLPETVDPPTASGTPRDTSGRPPYRERLGGATPAVDPHVKDARARELESKEEEAAAPAPAREGVRKLVDMIRKRFDEAGRTPPIQTVELLARRLHEYTLEQAEEYVLEALGNMADADDSKVFRSITKPQHITQRIQTHAQATHSAPDRDAVTAEELRAMEEQW